MKRIAVLILALALMLTGSALAVYDPAASTPTMWDGEVTTITFTSRLPNIVLENNPVLKRVEEAVGVRLEISVLDAAQYNSLIAVQIADHFLLHRDRFAVAADARNLVIWLMGFVAYRLLMGVDTPVGYTLPDMVLTILLCVIAEKLKPSVKQ